MEGSIIEHYEKKYKKFWLKITGFGILLLFGGSCFGVLTFKLVTESRRLSSILEAFDIPIFFFGLGSIGAVLLLLSIFKACRFNRSPFMRSIDLQAEWLGISLSEVCDAIDDDIRDSGLYIGKLVVGKKWLLSDRAMCYDRIKEIKRNKRFGKGYIEIVTVDDILQYYDVGSDKEANKAIEYLNEWIPNLCKE